MNKKVDGQIKRIMAKHKREDRDVVKVLNHVMRRIDNIDAVLIITIDNNNQNALQTTLTTAEAIGELATAQLMLTRDRLLDSDIEYIGDEDETEGEE